MSQPLRRGAYSTLVIAAAVAVPMLTACRKEPPPPAPNAIVIRASDFVYQMPDTIPSGVTRIRLVNAGPSLHHVALIKLSQGKTYDSLLAALRNPGPPPTWIEFIGSPNASTPGDTSEVISNLAAGAYAVICVIPDSLGRPHFALGMSHPLTVTAASGPAAAEPTADLSVSLTDFDFVFSAPPTAGQHTIRVSNDSPQPHEIFIAKLDSGATAQQLVTWVAAGMHGRPPATPHGGTVGISPGGHAYLVTNLTPGTYGLYCFFPDKTDGKEHVQHGMMKTITVS